MPRPRKQRISGDGKEITLNSPDLICEFVCDLKGHCITECVKKDEVFKDRKNKAKDQMDLILSKPKPSDH